MSDEKPQPSGDDHYSAVDLRREAKPAAQEIKKFFEKIREARELKQLGLKQKNIECLTVNTRQAFRCWIFS
jgi:hypothetical protein